MSAVTQPTASLASLKELLQRNNAPSNATTEETIRLLRTMINPHSSAQMTPIAKGALISILTDKLGKQSAGIFIDRINTDCSEKGGSQILDVLVQPVSIEPGEAPAAAMPTVESATPPTISTQDEPALEIQTASVPAEPDSDDFFNGMLPAALGVRAAPEVPEKPAPPAPLSFFHSIALPLAARGLKVIPVNPDKSCTIPEHQKLATLDAAKIAQWTGPSFDNQNVGVHCLQEEGGVVIIDRDSKLVDLWAEYTKETGRSKPVSYEVQSTPPCSEYPSGKSHLYFYQTPRTIQMSSNITESTTGGLFSLRLKNYYVCGEGSNHPNGHRYTEISNAPIVPMPDELLDWLLSKTATEKKPATLQGDPIPYGQHETELFRIGCNMRRMGLEEDAIYSALCEVCQKRCVGYGDDWQDMCRKKAHQAATKYPVGNPEPNVILGGKSISSGNVSTPPQTSLPSAEVAWTKPKPFDVNLSPVLPFKIEFLPSCMQSWAQDVSERMSVPLDFAGICALEVLAGVINRRAFVYPKQLDKEWKEPIAISGAVVAASGKIKTPVWKVFTNILVEIECTWREQYEARLAQYKNAMDVWEAGKKIGIQPHEPEPCRRLILNDSTPEKMHLAMKDNPAGLFVYRDEMAGWIAELDQKGREGELAIYLAAMNGDDPHAVDRVGREFAFAKMSGSFFGGFQPDVLIQFLSNTRNISVGLVPRFGLMVWPDDARLPLIDRPANEQAKTRFRRLIMTLAEIRAESGFLHFAPDAQSLFNDWYAQHKNKVEQETQSGRQSHLSKYSGLLPRLAGLLQLADIVDSGMSPVGNQLIDKEHLNRAIGLILYLESHMVRVYGCIKSIFQQAVESLAKHVQDGDIKDSFTIRDVRRKHWTNLAKSDEVMDALDELEEHYYIRSIESRNGVQGGRPTLRWLINPILKEKNDVD